MLTGNMSMHLLFLEFLLALCSFSKPGLAGGRTPLKTGWLSAFRTENDEVSAALWHMVTARSKSLLALNSNSTRSDEISLPGAAMALKAYFSWHSRRLLYPSFFCHTLLSRPLLRRNAATIAVSLLQAIDPLF